MGLGARPSCCGRSSGASSGASAGTRKIKVNLRVVAASNVSLEDCVPAGRFRPDLFYRLKVLSLGAAALRDRKEAIAVLAQRFLDEVTARRDVCPGSVCSPEALCQLVRYDWPGNVRELRNVMESVALMGPKASDRRWRPCPRTSAKVGEGVVQIAAGSTLRTDDAEKEIIRRTSTPIRR